MNDRARRRTMRRAALRTGFVVLLAGAAAGCADGLQSVLGEPPKLYLLTSKSAFSPGLSEVGWQLAIEPPIAEAGLDTARIALRRDPVSLEYYAGASWVDAAPIMIQTLLVESFENSGRIVGVGRQSAALRPDYSLRTDLREFQAEYDGQGQGPPRVRVRLNAKLVKMPQRTIIGATTVERTEAAAAADMGSVVRAFDRALGKVLKRIVEWTFDRPIPEES